MDRSVVWSMFFMQVVSWQYHPGIKQRLTLEECADVADEMIQFYEERYPPEGS